MKCPYCTKEMKQGKIMMYEWGSILKMPATLKYTSLDKQIKRKVTSGDEEQGWYCDRCKKMIAVYDATSLWD